MKKTIGLVSQPRLQSVLRVPELAAPPTELHIANMKIAIFILLLVLFAAACSSKTGSNDVTGASQPQVSRQKAAAQTSAEEWLALVDAGNYAASWKTSASLFQAAISQDQWAQTIAAVRRPLGDLVARKLKSAESTKSLPGAPDGQYMVLQFDTSFANKKVALETVTPMLEADGTWRVSGYYIK